MRKRTGSKASLIYLYRPAILSSAIPADCSVCGRGVEDGFTVTAQGAARRGHQAFLRHTLPLRPQA